MKTLQFQAGATAFGDGTHPTTAGVLAALEAIDPHAFTPRIACDMGAGSGVLSLAIAERFGCPVVAVEVERQAIDTMQKNAAENGLADKLIAVHSDGFAHPDIAAHAPYDLIVMNILADPLLRLASRAVEHLAPGGVIIVSGILQWQEEPLREAYLSLGLELAARLTVKEWVSLSFAKPE